VSENNEISRRTFIAKGAVLMPSFVNVGAYVGEGTMVDTWATVGSCAQIGKNCHISGGAGIGGVLEPIQAGPVVIEDNCFIGARAEVAEGVIVGEGSVLSMGVYLGQSTKIVDRASGAPLGGRVRITTWLTVVLVVVIHAAIVSGLLLERHQPPWPVWPILLVAPALVGAIWYGALVRRYRLLGDEIVIERAWLTVRLPLAGLTAVEPDREALRGAWKIMGNDGLGAYAGRFRSKKLGKFRAYVSDPDCAVVLRWPDRCLVVSPAQPGEFVDAVRARLAGRH